MDSVTKLSLFLGHWYFWKDANHVTKKRNIICVCCACLRFLQLCTISDIQRLVRRWLSSRNALGVSTPKQGARSSDTPTHPAPQVYTMAISLNMVTLGYPELQQVWSCPSFALASKVCPVRWWFKLKPSRDVQTCDKFALQCNAGSCFNPFFPLDKHSASQGSSFGLGPFLIGFFDQSDGWLMGCCRPPGRVQRSLLRVPRIYICSSFIYLLYAAVARASGWSIPHSAPGLHSSLFVELDLRLDRSHVCRASKLHIERLHTCNNVTLCFNLPHIDLHTLYWCLGVGVWYSAWAHDLVPMPSSSRRKPLCPVTRKLSTAAEHCKQLSLFMGWILRLAHMTRTDPRETELAKQHKTKSCNICNVAGSCERFDQHKSLLTYSKLLRGWAFAPPTVLSTSVDLLRLRTVLDVQVSTPKC